MGESLLCLRHPPVELYRKDQCLTFAGEPFVEKLYILTSRWLIPAVGYPQYPFGSA
jgi:hypothetical protein